jgi:hypothetical protein
LISLCLCAFVVNSDRGIAASRQDSGGQHEEGFDESQHSPHREAQHPERQENQPDQREQQQGHKRQRPAEHQQNQKK